MHQEPLFGQGLAGMGLVCCAPQHERDTFDRFSGPSLGACWFRRGDRSDRTSDHNRNLDCGRPIGRYPPDHCHLLCEEPSLTSDASLVALFHRRPDDAWKLFIERYADRILSQLRRLGFDHDEAMDRFVYVCEKLSENDYRRLRAVRYPGDRGDLTPWLRAVVNNLSISWTWSKYGRRRLPESVKRLSSKHQSVFRHYFFGGLAPSEVLEALHQEGDAAIDLLGVLDSLERIFEGLSHGRLWRLVCNMARSRQCLSLDAVEGDGQPALERKPAEPDPLQALLQKESSQKLTALLEELSTKQRLVIQLRYEEAMRTSEIASITGQDEKTVRSTLRSCLRRLRRRLS